jgi:hypothetical protein
MWSDIEPIVQRNKELEAELARLQAPNRQVFMLEELG